ncbi:major capsid protein [Phycisphaerales bacterium AB-hyl4]|uniref:Major capsid protein n=1 Tax=Natronomicrosphaera hydrolytica TaxID=3242702 RepID=A0ABV4U4J0_9BACT
MPEFLTLADLVKINDQNLADRNITDLLNRAPFLAALPADEASNGTTHKYTKEVGAPVVGFRNVNEGREQGKSADELVSIDLKILDASFAVDKALADAYRLGPDAYVGREAARHLRAAFFAAEQQMINGTGKADGDGFTGLADEIGWGHQMFVNVGGAGATADKSSVYLVRATEDMDNVVAITGREGQIDIGETVVQQLTEGTTLKKYSGYYTPIEGWAGLQVGGLRSVARIANIDDGDNKVTDDLIYQALERFPGWGQPTMIVMNRRSLRQLRESRTATNATGAPAPRPTEVEGIPILTVESISSTEATVVEPS